MMSISSLRTFMGSNAGHATSLSVVTLTGIAGVALLYFQATCSSEASGVALIPSSSGRPDAIFTNAITTNVITGDTKPVNDVPIVSISKDKIESIGLKTIAALRSSWPERLRVTGRLEINESREAHVSSLVDGVIREVPVKLGQTVKRGDILAYIDSREVGEAKLQLVKDKLQLTLAKKTNQWYGTIQKNTSALLAMLREGQTLSAIDKAFQDRPVGTYRGQLVSALARLNRAKADFDRIQLLGADAIIAQKRVFHAREEYESADATYRALMEQIRFDAQQQSLDAQQELQVAEAAVAISRSHLLILGYSNKDIVSMVPLAEAERVAYYPIRSPIAGTVISKDAPLSQYVDRKTELMEIADLSTIWLRADVFEKDLDTIRGLQDQSVLFQVGSYPGQRFTAAIFSLGAVVDDETRAARLLANVDNSKRLLKPGMFVEVELTPHNDADVLQLPASAIQRHAGATFVFIADGADGADGTDGADGADGFERRDVTIGRSTSELVEIKAGLIDEELAVIKGGFALKSEMLSELMVEE